MLLVETSKPWSGYLLQQAKNGHAVRRPHVHPSVRHHWCDEFIVGELVAPAGGLGGVVQLRRQVGGIVSVQHAGTVVLHGPDDPATGGIRGRYAWRRPGIGELNIALRGRRAGEHGVRDWEGFEVV